MELYPHRKEWFSNDCRKSKAKESTQTNHTRSKQRKEPIRIRTITCNLLKAQDKSRPQGAIGFRLASLLSFV